MLQTKKMLVIILLLTHTVLSNAQKLDLAVKQDEQLMETKALIKRVIPKKHWNNFEIKFISQKEGKDIFEIESVNNKIMLSGNNGVAIASALGYYLKNYANCQITWNGVNLNLPEKLPRVLKKVSKNTVFDYRYYLNYCTYSYSMAWWDWKRWEKEIDWMALHGINMPLSLIGQNAVWYRVYKGLGFSDKELAGFFTGPAHYAWFWMGNIDSIGGPLPYSIMQKQELLQKKILNRERALGMKPILTAFTGHVPLSFKQKFPNATLKQIEWGRRYHTQLLNPSDTLFIKIGELFMKEQIKTYGTDHLYAADTFNENLPPTNDSTFLSNVSKHVYTSMSNIDPKAVWIMQGWLFVNNPTFWQPPQIKALLGAVPDDSMIILDLWSETRPVWKRTESYYGKPWIWCMLQNFGGNVGMFGKLDTVAIEPLKTFNSTHKGNMVGIGLTPEGIEQNPVMFELMMDNVWQKNGINVNEWLNNYIKARYGATPKQAIDAWQILRKTVYNGGGSQGAPESILTGRPTFKKQPRWTDLEMNYDPKDLLPAWKNFIACANQLKNSDGFQYDIVDVTRQVLANYCTTLREEMVVDYNHKDLKSFETKAKTFIDILSDMDELLNTRTDFLLGKWINDAKQMADTDEQKRKFEQNAKVLITLWSDKDASLHDYANKQWAGMLKGFYKPRWEQFFEYSINCLKTQKQFDEDWFYQKMKDWEWQWVNNQEMYSKTPKGNAVDVSLKLFRKYNYLLK